MGFHTIPKRECKQTKTKLCKPVFRLLMPRTARLSSRANDISMF